MTGLQFQWVTVDYNNTTYEDLDQHDEFLQFMKYDGAEV